MAKTYTTVPDLASGATVTETNWDTHLRDNINNLIVRPAARVYHSAAQSATSGVSLWLAFNSERYDTDAIHDTATNNSRLTCQTAGIYLVEATLAFAANVTGVRGAQLLLNGTTNIAIVREPAATGGHEHLLTISTTWAFAVNDYVEVLAFQSSGGALNVTAASAYSAEFMMTWIGRTS